MAVDPVRRIIGFAPDLDPITPGIILEANDFYPTVKGVQTLPDLHKVSNALGNRCFGAISVVFDDGTNFLIAGTSTDLNWVQPSTMAIGAWQTQAVGSVTLSPWRFAQYKQAGSTSEPLVIATQAGAGRIPLVATKARLLNPAANPPVWRPLDATAYFSNHPASIVAATDAALFLIQPESSIWWASTNPTLWTPDIATETVTSSLDGTPGPITAAKSLRNFMVIYKETATYIGAITTPPLIWDFGSPISHQVGAVSHEAVVSVKDVHYFLGPDDFYTFDGFSVNPLPNPLKEWFFDHMSDGDLARVQARYDGIRNCVFWHCAPDPTTEDLTRWICVNVRTGQWMTGERNVEAVVDGPLVLDPNAGVRSVGLVQDDHVVWAYAPPGVRTTPAFLITGDIGDRHYLYQISRMRPGFSVQAGTNSNSPTLDVLSAYVSGLTLPQYQTALSNIPLSADGWFNFVNTGRLQRLRLNVSADCEIATYELSGMDQAGEA